MLTIEGRGEMQPTTPDGAAAGPPSGQDPLSGLRATGSGACRTVGVTG